VPGNTLLTISMITQRALPVLANLCIFTDKVNRQYDREFGVKGRKIGGTCNIRLPPRFLGTFGPALNVEPVTETYVPLSILYQFHVDIQFNTINMVLDVDEFEDRYIHPACVAVANRLDSDACFFAAQNFANRLGTPGIMPTAYRAFSDARAILVSEGMPKGLMPVAVLHPLAQSSMADSLKGLYNPQITISDIYETGMVAAKTAGADWFEDPNIAAYLTGRLTGTPVLAGTSAQVGGSAIITAGSPPMNTFNGWGHTGTLNLQGLTSNAPQCYVGDTIQIAGLYPVNPQNRVRYGNTPKQFAILPPGGYMQMMGMSRPGGPQFGPAVLANGTFDPVTGLYTSDGSGRLQLLIGECIILGGQFANCVADPTLWTGHPAVTLNNGTNPGTNSTENLYLHRDAMAMAMVDLPLPRTAVEASRAYDEDLGISIRVVTQYTINNDAEPTRMDVAYGFGVLYRSMGVRVSG